MSDAVDDADTSDAAENDDGAAAESVDMRLAGCKGRRLERRQRRLDGVRSWLYLVAPQPDTEVENMAAGTRACRLRWRRTNAGKQKK